MTVSIGNWNIAENIVWFVRLADWGSAISVEMYLTQADAQAQTNLQASGSSSGYGSDLDVTLTNAPDATNPVSLFIDAYAWHLQVNGENGDPVKIFKVKRFVELEEISHSIYRNSILIAARAEAEINAHTHAAIIRDIILGTHLPEIEVGQTAGLVSDRRGVDDLSQIHEHRITGTPDSLISEVEIRKYMELKR
jgi:hypothetical protein